jgi:hypothetical protein
MPRYIALVTVQMTCKVPIVAESEEAAWETAEGLDPCDVLDHVDDEELEVDDVWLDKPKGEEPANA